MAEKGILTAADLLGFFPYKYLDRRSLSEIRTLAPGQGTVVGKVLSSGIVYLGRRRLFEIALGDETGVVSLKWFHFYPRMFSRFQKGTVLIASGEVTRYRGENQFVHPQVEVLDDDFCDIRAPGIVPLYSQIPGIGQKTIRKIIGNCLERVELLDPLPPALLKEQGIPAKEEAIFQIHFPEEGLSLESLNEARSPAHRREIFEEFFLMEMGLALKRRSLKREPGIAFNCDPQAIEEWKRLLPFKLTSAQETVLREIFQDMGQDQPMNRLLQGDVGSGKTVVALLAAWVAIQNSYQAALMVPTEILAEQHFRTASRLLAPYKIPIALLTGSQTQTEKEKILSRLRRGIYPLVIGTHALIQEGVHFKNLGLVIIDEQHRFGVLQRQMIRQKGRADVLVMTATPIPRTLAMTVYGDLDLSLIDEMPPGRQPIRTIVLESRNRRALYEQIHSTLSRGEQGYIIYPLIEESEKLVLKDATRMHEELKKIFPTFRLALLHGRISPEEREQIFARFRKGEVDLLVSTTVIEVGVDIPNATLMVIEHADRFGLSQLHQLRGRVGRGEKPSSCLLISDSFKSEAAFRRLEVMSRTQNGFEIAEEDLKIRGAGDFLGTRQSGLPDLRIANLLRDTKILQEAREAVFRLIEKDPALTRYSSLKKELFQKWGKRLSLAEVG